MTTGAARSVAYVAAVWAFVFGVFHVVWATGWYVGLSDPAAAREAFSRPFTWWYDVVVAGMCFVAVPVALALSSSWGERVPRRAIAVLAWTGAALLGVRAVASIVHAIYLFLSRGFVFPRMSVWEPWFYLGATLFGVNLWLWRRRVSDRVPSTAKR